MSDIINVTITDGVSNASLNTERNARINGDSELSDRIGVVEEDLENVATGVTAGTVPVTTGSISVTISDNKDFTAFAPTGDIVFTLTGTQTNGKEHSYFVNGTGNGFTATVTGANLQTDPDIIFDDQEGYQYWFLIYTTATGVPFYGIQKYPQPTTVNLAPGGNVVITGTATQGQLLSGIFTYSDNEGDAAATHLYQWYRADSSSGSNVTPISGSTSTTYLLTLTDVGKYIRLGVTPQAATGTSPGAEVFSSYTSQIQSSVTNTAPTATDVTISGSPVQGNTLTASYTYQDAELDPEGSSLKQWYRADNTSGLNEAAISGETNLTYVVQSGDVGKYLIFRVVPVASSGETPGDAVSSSYTSVVTASDTTAPTVSSATTASANTITIVFSESVSVTTDGWSFKKNGSSVSPSSVSGSGNTWTFTLPTTFISSDTILRSYNSSTGNTVDLASTPNELVSFTDSSVTNNIANEAPVASSPAISGTAQVGQTLTASFTYSDTEGDAAGTHLYQWYRADSTGGLNEAAISGATSVNYGVTSSDIYKYLRVRITPRAATGTITGTAVYSSYTSQVQDEALTGIWAEAVLYDNDFSAYNPFNGTSEFKALDSVNYLNSYAVYCEFTPSDGVPTGVQIPFGLKADTNNLFNIAVRTDGSIRFAATTNAGATFVGSAVGYLSDGAAPGPVKILGIWDNVAKQIKIYGKRSTDGSHSLLATANVTSQPSPNYTGIAYGGAYRNISAAGSYFAGDVFICAAWSDKLLNTTEIDEIFS